jgi:uncharacterized protein YjbI with pentapeptide repeats
MMARFRFWWEKIRQHPVAAIFVFVGIVLVIVMIVLGYLLNWHWTGLVSETSEPKQHAKTLWDWLQLLIIPLVLAVAALLFNLANTRTERQIALDKQHEDLLQAYLDRISELLLKENLRTSPSEEVQNVARVRTITVLTQLDARRVGYVFAFLREAELMSATKDDNAISLKNADLHAVNWSQADLRGADLSGANLNGAYLQRADLRQANLSGADLSGANLSDAIFFRTSYVPRALSGTIILPNSANLSGADLSGANLSGAKFTDEQLAEVRSLKGAIMPDGKPHP